MKITMTTIILLVLSILGQAQNKTIKLYLKQIAANKVYIEYLQKGYKIAKNGLNTIGKIKNGHFSLDKDFFAGLQSINPKVRNYVKVADIVAMNVEVAEQYKKAVNESRKHDMYNKEELTYINKVFSSLIENCTMVTDELILLVTPNKLKMSDDERINQIDKLHSDMQDNYVFVNSFSGTITMMTLQRMKEARDAASVRTLHGGNKLK